MSQKPHPTQTPEYWERLAQSERTFAQQKRTSRTGTVESIRAHEAAASDYEETARRLRDQAVTLNAKVTSAPMTDARLAAFEQALRDCIAGHGDALSVDQARAELAIALAQRQQAPTDESAWWALAMGAAASLEDAALCMRDVDAEKAARGAAAHVRKQCAALTAAAQAEPQERRS